MRDFVYMTLVIASVAWLIPWPSLLLLSAAVWIGVYFLTLPRQAGVKQRSERDR